MRLLMFRELGRPRPDVSGAWHEDTGKRYGIRLIYAG